MVECYWLGLSENTERLSLAMSKSHDWSFIRIASPLEALQPTEVGFKAMMGLNKLVNGLLLQLNYEFAISLHL